MMLEGQNFICLVSERMVNTAILVLRRYIKYMTHRMNLSLVYYLTGVNFREVEFGLPDGRDNDGYNGVGFVEKFKIFATQEASDQLHVELPYQLVK